MRHVRNSWARIELSDREKVTETGPKGSNGEMHATFYMRKGGESVTACTVSITREGEKTVLRIFGPDGFILHKMEVDR